MDHTAKLDKNGKPVLLGVTETGQIRRILVDEDGALIVSGGGSGGGSLAIYDENSLINAQTTKINFIGADVQASQNSVDENMVNIYIPPSLYTSHFNENDGTVNALVSNITTYTRYVASPTSEGSPYNIGEWIGGSLQTCVNSSTISYSNVNTFSILDNTSTVFTATLLDADGVSVLATRDLTLTGNSDDTVNNIRIQITNWAEELGKYKAKITVTFNISSIIPNGGRFSVYMQHNNGAEGIFPKAQSNLFYDANINAAVITGTTILETSGQVVTKYLSGVEVYTTGSKFTVSLADIDYLNDRSYPLTQVQINAPNFGLANINLQGSQLTGWTNAYDNVNATYSNNAWAISATNYYLKTTSANAYARPIDWVAGAWDYSSNNSIIVDTYVENSTRIYEDFRTETNRLLADLVTSWDNTQNITIYDSGTGLQVLGSQLIYPTEDFGIYAPNSGTQPNYSNETGTKYYYRRFYHPTLTSSNGILTFSGHNLTEAKLDSGDFNIKISIDGTNWYRLNGDYFGGTLVDGDACRINSDSKTLSLTNSLEFTLSTFFSSELYLEISYMDTVNGRTLFIDSVGLSWA